jgi:hypothetical protein
MRDSLAMGATAVLKENRLMGFTRYWRRPRELDRDKFSLFAKECLSICNDFAEVIACIETSDEKVRLLGQPECEAFVVPRISNGRERDGLVSEYCKTQGLPYDAAVERCLAVLAEYFPEVELPSPS